MPIYEYECSSCHSLFERRQRFDEEPITSCPKCSGKARRLIHSVPVIFKGSGFYCTDHGNNSTSCTLADKCKETECKAKLEAKECKAKPETKECKAKSETKETKTKKE